MKKMLATAVLALACFALNAQPQGSIKLPDRSPDRGSSMAKAFEQRKSDRSYADRQLSMQDLGDLLWSANGFNRADRRTAATAVNAQEIDLYVCLPDGAYLYNAQEHRLDKVTTEDIRPGMGRGTEGVKPPVCLLIVADMSRSPLMERDVEAAHRMAAYDSGIVSANIYLFCSANGLGTVCRAGMDKEPLIKGLSLNDKQVIHINHPVGYLE